MIPLIIEYNCHYIYEPKLITLAYLKGQMMLQSGANVTVHPAFSVYTSRNFDCSPGQIGRDNTIPTRLQIKSCVVVILRYKSVFYYKYFWNGKEFPLALLFLLHRNGEKCEKKFQLFAIFKLLISALTTIPQNGVKRNFWYHWHVHRSAI